METFTNPPDYTSKVKKTPEKKYLAFGDGYTQRVAVGAIFARDEYSVTFSGTSSYIDEIEAFLVATKGADDFLWATPFGTTKQFFCGETNKQEDDYGNVTLTATFSQR